MSIILGHFSEVNIMNTELPPLSTPPVLSTLLRGELERWREDLPETMLASSNAPLVHISFWVLRILRELILPDSEPRDLLHCGQRIVRELLHNSNLVSPLTHHSTGLAALTLVELSAYESTKDEAEKTLITLRESHIAPTGWDAAIRDFIATKHGASISALTKQAADSQHALTASQGLQRLADIATAAEGNRDLSSGESRNETEKGNTSYGTVSHLKRYHELRDLVRSGYLNALGGESAR